MKTKIRSVLILLAVMSTLTMAVPIAFAAKPSTSSFEWWQFYDGWGPSEYYGQKVLVHYTSINRWVLNKQATNGGWNIEQTLTQNGVAEVYDATTGSPFTDSYNVDGLKGSLIESDLKFRVAETTKGYVDVEKSWYHRNDVDILKVWNYHWIIPSVYHYVGQYHHGEWTSKVLKP